MNNDDRTSEPQAEGSHGPITVNEATPMPSTAGTVSLQTQGWTPGDINVTELSDQTPADATAPKVRQFGSYLILNVIAHGGMGIVYRARHIDLGREVALKVILGNLQLKPSLLERFYQEAQAIAQLKHPNIIQLFEFGVFAGHHFFTMNLAAGGSLHAHLERFQSNPRQAVALMEKVARAVQHVHDRGILHRDLKPANILLDAGDEPLVSDFGLAKSLELELELTHSGAAIGTPSYMAPEQAAGRGDLVSSKTDVWALGVILYQLLCGKKPFEGDSREEVMRAIQESEPSTPRLLQPSLDRSMEAILQKCLEKEPRRRYPSAGALADDLGAWLRGESVRARPMGHLRRCWRWLRKHPTTVGICVASILAALTAFVVWERVDPDRELRILERKLVNREVVEITSPRGLAWHRWRLPGAFAVAGEPAAVAIQSTSLSLLEVVRDPMSDHYTLRAEVQHYTASFDGEVGVYLGHRQYDTPDGTFHGFLGLTFVDHGRLADVKDAKKVSLTPYLWKPSGTMFVQQREFPTIVQDIIPYKSVKKSEWRRVALVVSPHDLAVYWEDRLLGKETWTRLQKSADDLMANNRRANPAYGRGLPLEYSPRLGIGFYVNKGQASFRNVVLDPSDNPFFPK